MDLQNVLVEVIKMTCQEIGGSIVSQPEWGLRDKDDILVCNFIPRVTKVEWVKNSSTSKARITLKIDFGEEKFTETTVWSKDLDKIYWPDIDIRCIVFNSCRKSKDCIANHIRADITNLSETQMVKKYSLNRLGIHKIENDILFVAGDRVISRPPALDNDDYILNELNGNGFSLHLDIDETLSSEEAFRGMEELISLSDETGEILLAHAISGIMRAAFIEAGFFPSEVIMIVGKSGLLKSNYVTQLVQLYNRGDRVCPITRLNSTKSYIENLLANYQECTVVIDDLHTGESKSIIHNAKENAEEIIRQISDNVGRGRMDGNTRVQHRFDANVVMIGEYPIGKDSTIPRYLEVPITKAPNGEILDKYQREQPLLVSTFYWFFIKWYVAHYESITEKIDIKLTAFRKESAGSQNHGRLNDTLFYLLVSYRIYLNYCLESGFMTDEIADKRDSTFSKRLLRLVMEQQYQLDDIENAKQDIDYLGLIRQIYKNGKFKIASSVKEFNSGEFDGMFYYDCLCIRGKNLDHKIKKYIPHANRDMWVRYLKDHNALKMEGQKRTVQINGCSGKRFYAIWQDKLN